MSDVLLSTNLDLSKAADLVSATIETLEEFRCDSDWQKVWTYTQSIAELHCIPVSTYSTDRPQRTAQLPSQYDDSTVQETIGSQERNNSSEGYKVEFYYPMLDAFLSELNQRFTDKNRTIMKSSQACCPSSPHFLDISYLEP